MMLVKAKSDLVFKKLFTDKDNKEILLNFVADMLQISVNDITELEVKNGELAPEKSEAKSSRLDLLLKVNGSLVNVEIQLNNNGDFQQRTLYYWSRLYSSEIKSGESYSVLKRTITINILDFNMFSDNLYSHSVSCVVNETGERFCDELNILFFELKKLGRTPNLDDKRYLWCQFLNSETEKEYELIKTTGVDYMERAVKVIYNMSADAQVQEALRLKEKHEHDVATAMSNKININNAKHAQSMLEFGIPIQSIAEIMKLSVEKVEELLKLEITDD